MKLKFKKQAYQTHAVEAVVDCFAGQPKREGWQYRVYPGRAAQAKPASVGGSVGLDTGLRLLQRGKTWV